MTAHSEVETYNYAAFDGGEDFAAFRTALHVGSSAPDFNDTLLECGEQVQLRQY